VRAVAAAAVLGAIAPLLGAAPAPSTAASEQRVKLCDPTEVKQTVRRFISAFNAGNLAALDRQFAPRPFFRWYSTMGPGEHLLPVAADRKSLISYLARRHERGERLTLRGVRVTGNTIALGAGWKPYGNFVVQLVRQADDLPPTNYQGKGALHCYRSRADQLTVWSMAPTA
jgi:hypothetical protein